MQVPTCAIVQNMAYFDCEHGTRYYPFGRADLDELRKACRLPPVTERETIFSLPLQAELATVGR